MADESPSGEPKTRLTEVLPKAGLVYSEKGNLSEVLCKPKIMPIRPQNLVRKEQAELDAEGEEEDEGEEKKFESFN